MNFCKDIDLYISLYIDELLEDNDKDEFLKHIEECTYCAQKLKDESCFAGLCKDHEEMELPHDFSASLHAKLLEVNKQENKSKVFSFIYNKKLIAGLSTAAVLAVSILAYNLLPDMGNGFKTASTSQSADSGAAMAPESGTEHADSQLAGSAETADGYAGSSDMTSEAEKRVTGEDNNQNSVMFSFSKAVPDSGQAASGETNRGVTNGDVQAATKSKKTESGEQKAMEQQTQSPVSDATDQNNELSLTMAADVKYFSNYAELNLKVSSVGTEFDNFKRLMKEIGAVEQSINLNKQSSERVNTFVADTSVVPEYTDYSMPLGLYASLQNQALVKYQLDLIKKTDIIKNDVTAEYNSLVQQKLDIEEKINDALEKGGDTTALEAEKTDLTKAIDSLITNQGMITVRVFFTDR